MGGGGRVGDCIAGGEDTGLTPLFPFQTYDLYSQFFFFQFSSEKSDNLLSHYHYHPTSSSHLSVFQYDSPEYVINTPKDRYQSNRSKSRHKSVSL